MRWLSWRSCALGAGVGAILIRRMEVRRFTDEQVRLLQTFADQALIAIENTRLVTALTTAVDKQTATGDILRVISGSRTDVQPVFDAIVHSAVRLLRGHTGALSRVAGDRIYLAVGHLSSVLRSSYAGAARDVPAECPPQRVLRRVPFDVTGSRSHRRRARNAHART